MLVLKTLSLGYLRAVPTVTELVTSAHTGVQYTIHAHTLSHMHVSTHIHTAPTSMCIGTHIHSQCTYIQTTLYTHMHTQSTQVHTHVYTCTVHKNSQVCSYMRRHVVHTYMHTNAYIHGPQMHFPLADRGFPGPGGGSSPRAQVSRESLTCLNILAESHPHSPWQVHPTAGLTFLICTGGRSTSETAQHMWPQMELFIISFLLHPYFLTHPANCPLRTLPPGQACSLGSS